MKNTALAEPQLTLLCQLFSDVFDVLARHLKKADPAGMKRVNAEIVESALSTWAKGNRLPLQLPEIRAITRHYTEVRSFTPDQCSASLSC